MTSPTNLKIIGDLSPTTWGAGSVTDKTAHVLFEQPPLPPPSQDHDALTSVPASSGVEAVDTKSVEIPATGAAKFWATRANQADKVKQALARSAQSPDAAGTIAALDTAREFFATLRPGAGNVDGKPTAIQLQAIAAVYDAFLPVAERALVLLGAQPDAVGLRGALVAAVTVASETATNDDLAALANRVSPTTPDP